VQALGKRDAKDPCDEGDMDRDHAICAVVQQCLPSITTEATNAALVAAMTLKGWSLNV